jgi:hypothetical protein
MDQMNSKNSEGAIQMLVWAIEEIAKTGNKKAEHHARLALKHLRPSGDERTIS